MNDTNALVNALRQQLEDSFLKYVLNLADDVVLDDFEVATKGQAANLATLAQIGGLGTNNSAPMDYLSWHSLSGYISSHDTSLVNLLRKNAGGSVELPQLTQDDVVDALADIAKDIWPMFMIRPKSDYGPRPFWMGSAAHAYGHPNFHRAIEAVLADESLKKLFPFEPTETNSSGDPKMDLSLNTASFVVTSLGSWTMQLAGLAPGLIGATALRCLMMDGKLSMSLMMARLSTVVDEVRRLADGQDVDLCTLVGFTGVDIPVGKIDLGEMHLRSATDADRGVFLADANQLTTVLECTYPCRIYAVLENKFDDEDPFAGMSKYDSRTSEAARSFVRKVDLTRFSLLLASGSHEPWLLKETARYIANPIHPGGHSSWDTTPIGLPSHSIGVDKFSHVSDWHRRVISKHQNSLDIGMRRLLLAGTRSDPIDAFVDAVVAWENMFGARTETTFRVTASIAKILAKEVGARKTLLDELKKIYTKRSSLVHGGAEPKIQEVWALRNRAMEVATECFRTVYRDRPDLLELTSDARGALLALE